MEIILLTTDDHRGEGGKGEGEVVATKITFFSPSIVSDTRWQLHYQCPCAGTCLVQTLQPLAATIK